MFNSPIQIKCNTIRPIVLKIQYLLLNKQKMMFSVLVLLVLVVVVVLI